VSAAPQTTILVIDPDAHARASLVQVLRGLGYAASAAADATSALRVARRERPAAVVTEYDLPVGNVRWLVDRLDAILTSGCPPVVVVSDDARAARCATWREVWDVLPKPVDVGALADAIDDALEGGPRPSSLALAVA
jgi:DNA-binding NtrC family response regulator